MPYPIDITPDDLAPENFQVALDDEAKARLLVISGELGRSVYDLIRTAAEEAALDYFRGRDDDPAMHVT